jgi:nitrate reductase gamma subunit
VQRWAEQGKSDMSETTRTAQKQAGHTQEGLLVWDLPLRLFHWGLAVAVMTNVVTANIGRMDLHERSGLTVLALVIFRVVWGFLGGTARCAGLVAFIVRRISAAQGGSFTARRPVRSGPACRDRFHGDDRHVCQ